MKLNRITSVWAVENYIASASQNGVIKKSMAEIGADIGVSNATVCRAIRTLVAVGVIEVVPGEKVNEPNTTTYLGSTDAVNNVVRGAREAIEELRAATGKLVEYVAVTERTLRSMKVELDAYHAFKRSIIKTESLPGTDTEMVIVKLLHDSWDG